MRERLQHSWLLVAASIASAKSVLGLSSVATGLIAHPSSAKIPLFVGAVLVFGVVGGVLVAAGDRDVRARTLGTLYLLIASVFADPLVSQPTGHDAPARTVLAIVMAIQIDAFSPYCLWRFVADFPRGPESRRVARNFAAMRALSSVVATLLIVGNGLRFCADYFTFLVPLREDLWFLARKGNVGLYWPVILLLSLAAVMTMLQRARRASTEERRRVWLLASGLALGIGPTIVWVGLQGIWHSFSQILPLNVAGWVVYPTLLSTPVTTAYAVLVQRALDVRVVVRRALQYALAKYSTLVAALLPASALVWSLYRHRGQTIAELATAPTEVLLALLTVIAGAALGRREWLLARIDRVFFREHYDVGRSLGEFLAACRSANDKREVSSCIRTALTDALHLDAISVFVLDEREGAFVSPEQETRPLRLQTQLTRQLESVPALDVDVERRGSIVHSLPEEELHWIVDGGFRLLVSLHDLNHRMAGLIALGEKRSELPFSATDRELIRWIGQAAETALFRYRIAGELEASGASAIASVAEEFAMECGKCRGVQATGRPTCIRCGEIVASALVPPVVGGKYLIDERIGAGAMGVVYRGMDVELGRLVAIKTLPSVSPRQAMRLRREARTVASVSHPNLATIYVVETWQGHPMLVFEYLSRGTLAELLRAGPLAVGEALSLGTALAGALSVLHGAGILHRDIKPSNIGYDGHGTPKLLDFGIAEMLTSHSHGVARVDSMPTTDTTRSPVRSTETVLRGTPLYMSPEARQGDAPNATFDLWSLTVVLAETVLGWHPMSSADTSVVLTPSKHYLSVAAFEQLAAVNGPCAAFFRRALSSRQSERPQTADELQQRIKALAAALGVTQSSTAAPGSSSTSEERSTAVRVDTRADRNLKEKRAHPPGQSYPSERSSGSVGID